MTLMRNKSQNIKFEAFQIFKIFVANPKKTRPVEDTLIKNQLKLIEFLNNFSFPDQRKEDEQFNDERKFVISKLSSLQGPTTSAVSSTPSSASSSPNLTSGTNSAGFSSSIPIKSTERLDHRIPSPSSANPMGVMASAASAPPPVVHNEPVHRNDQVLHYPQQITNRPEQKKNLL